MIPLDRDAMRTFFFETWQKHKENRPVTPMEAQLIEIVLLHPEYQAVLEDREKYQTMDFADANPFLHLGLHIAIRDQISTNRPAGIGKIYQQRCQRFGDNHAAEHKMLDCLTKLLWDAQQEGKIADENTFLENLKKI